MKKRRPEDAPAEQALSGTIAIGTYDGALLVINAADGRQVFGYAPHIGCVKALHCSNIGRMASGGTDNVVRLFNVAKGVELGELQEHEDTVSCLEFWGTTTLVTGGSDGQLCVWRCKDFELLYKCKAHKTGISSVSVHPSGRLAATAGKDASIRLWDLSRGTNAAHLTIEAAADLVVWSPTGKALAVLGQKEVLLVDTATSAVAKYQDPAASSFMLVPLTAVDFLSDDAMLVGDGKGSLRVFTLASNDKASLSQVCSLSRSQEGKSGPSGRVKAISRFPDSSGQAAGFFAVGMSTGSIDVWQCKSAATPADSLTSSSFQCIRTIDTGARLTCLAVWAGTAQSKSKEAEPQVTEGLKAELQPLTAADVGAKVTLEEDTPTNGVGQKKKRKKATPKE
mmetsp:Transcript_41921/g.98303  ORF Transcript_41921/g.98303 Transcript_41921/m.98303 type:complete len:395 (+) Transcript_41921:242-1426(+)|eukprot:CAMPEP_0178390204 /NCGR_PEP_ID=MMETSP0689_2-20121128/10523_1 /TAXON_ID=160604 /ORGANISM="Amphidinium massartii, Strain CS-259" /LENGTH=394 /DNA_ID=CAMNT_0020010701 /DNA_START=89 /DNA_END=1273 /DNA_ORIENTATION=+